LRAFAALALGITAVSFAAIFVRLAAAPGLVTAVYRLLLTALILRPAALLKSQAEFRRLSGHDWRLALAAGALLALHVATWISSRKFTTVAASVALLSTAPVWVALATASRGNQSRASSCGELQPQFLSASFVTVVILSEPVGSTALAYFLLRETPSLAVLVGGALILVGIAVASIGERRSALALTCVETG